VHNKLQLNFSIWPIAQDILLQEKLVGITQLQTEQYRHQPTQNRPDHPRYQELFADHFVILAKNIFGYESLLVMMDFMISMVGIVRNDCLTVSMYRQISTHQ
jgi:hypothetical protein